MFALMEKDVKERIKKILADFSIINDNNAKLLKKVFKEGTTALTGSDPKE